MDIMEKFRGYPICYRTKNDGIIVIYKRDAICGKYAWYFKHYVSGDKCYYKYGNSSDFPGDIFKELEDSYYVRTEGWAQI